MPVVTSGPCTILSSSIHDFSQAIFVDDVAEVMSCFIHRLSSGRYLSFLTILGHICRCHCREYDEIVEYMDGIVGFSVSGSVLSSIDSDHTDLYIE
jgi:hypothetical protein